jgi:hypothetical protein
MDAAEELDQAFAELNRVAEEAGERWDLWRSAMGHWCLARFRPDENGSGGPGGTRGDPAARTLDTADPDASGLLGLVRAAAASPRLPMLPRCPPLMEWKAVRAVDTRGKGEWQIHYRYLVDYADPDPDRMTEPTPWRFAWRDDKRTKKRSEELAAIANQRQAELRDAWSAAHGQTVDNGTEGVDFYWSSHPFKLEGDK